MNDPIREHVGRPAWMPPPPPVGGELVPLSRVHQVTEPGKELVPYVARPVPVRGRWDWVTPGRVRWASVLAGVAGVVWSVVLLVKWALEAVATWWHGLWVDPVVQGAAAVSTGPATEHHPGGLLVLVLVVVAVLAFLFRPRHRCAGITMHCGGCDH